VRTPAELRPLYSEAARATAAGSKSFYLASRFFPDRLSRAAHSVYWFCRHTDDLVDECPTLEQGRRDLEDWAAQLNRALEGFAPRHPVLELFTHTMREFNIPHDYPLDMIEGMRMDLNGVRYQTFDELRVFCYRVASVVGLMMSHVIGFRHPALSHAIDMGIAMQLTNILRDVGEDLERGRVYLPSDEMARFGYAEEDLHRRIHNDAFVELMRFQADRARGYYEQAEPGIDLLNPDGRFAVKVALQVYRQILSQIERNGYDVFARRAVVPPMRKYGLIAANLAGPAARYSWQRLAFWRS